MTVIKLWLVVIDGLLKGSSRDAVSLSVTYTLPDALSVTLFEEHT